MAGFPLFFAYGIASFDPERDADIHATLTRADAEMYAHKRALKQKGEREEAEDADRNIPERRAALFSCLPPDPAFKMFCGNYIRRALIRTVKHGAHARASVIRIRENHAQLF